MKVRKAKTKKYWNETMGFGEVIAFDEEYHEDTQETVTYLLVRFDADPWYPVWVQAEEE